MSKSDPTMRLEVAQGIALPIDYVTKTAAILAQRRKGKTYTAAVIAEELCAAGLPWVALDPTGAWWGLRSSRTGHSAGLPVIVIGGQHGDIPLDAHAGAAVADLVLDHPGWYVLDFSLLEGRPAEREFATAFGTRLHRRKQQAGMDFPLHLFIDEADLFLPQEKETKTDVPLLAAYSGIVRRGGLHGLGSTLISQRPALVNKNALTQLDIGILLRLVAGQDQDAVDKQFVSRFLDKEQRAEVMGSLAKLPVGTAWFLEPGEEPMLVIRAKVRERRTFNSSATPKPGEQRIEPTAFAKVDIDAIRDQMADSIERAAADDPVALRKEIWTLRGNLAEAERQYQAVAAELAAAPVETERVEVPILTAGDLLELTTSTNRIIAALDPVMALASSIRKFADVWPDEDRTTLRPPVIETTDEIVAARSRLRGRLIDGRETSPPDPGHRPPEPPLEHREAPSENGALGTAARSILEALARFYPTRMTVGQTAQIAGRKPRGGSFNTAMREIRDGGYADLEGSYLTLTPKGRIEMNLADTWKPMTRDQQVAMWREALPTTARELFDTLLSNTPPGMTTEELGHATGRAPRGGSWNTAIRTLLSNDLVERSGDTLRVIL